jgi:polyhydroxyalkanoate synthase
MNYNIGPLNGYYGASKSAPAGAADDDETGLNGRSQANLAADTGSRPIVGPENDPVSMQKSTTTEPAKITSLDVEAFSHNLARMIEEGGKALAAYMKPREEGKIKSGFDEVGEVIKTIVRVLDYWLSDPERASELQQKLGRAYLELWASMARRLSGETAEPVVKPDEKDKRFADPEWSQNQFFDFLKQAYLLTTEWADHLVKDADGLDPHTRQKAEFYVRQIGNAISPSNFVLTNPELLRETLSSNAENLVRGMHMLSEDIKAGHGNLRIRQSDPSLFEVGRNLALTPGKVVFQNDLIQLVQYEATTPEVLKVPLLIVPPWINKFYILDLTPEKSFIKWCVEHGITVFVISWVNPDAKLSQKSFEQYMREGVITAFDVVEEITGERKVHTVGYCVGGTLLAITLAYLAAKKQERAVSATLFAAQIDFTYAGDLMVFVDEDQIKNLEEHMKEQGYLEASHMANAFNLLRSNDLIWPYVVNNYLRGKAPYPFDILYWNSDATRMPAANHSFYLRNCYLENRLTKGKMEIAGTTLDLRKVKVPVYNLATREDHIAPAKSVLYGSRFFGGPVKYVLTGSGHIAGVINPPNKNKYQYWLGDTPGGADLAAWMKTAKEHAGSWWPDWLDWIKAQNAETVEARAIGGGKHKPIEDAPGSYVKVRSWE